MRFVIADTHFFGKNIMKYENRPFNTVEEMNNTFIHNWNSAVTKDDTVYMLGDFFDFDNCTYSQADDIVKKLNGKIVLILGNHDRNYVDFYRSQSNIIVEENPIIVDKYFMLSHEPMYVTVNSPYANIFGHVHSNPMYRDVSCRSFCACAERIGYAPIALDRAMVSIKNAN